MAFRSSLLVDHDSQKQGARERCEALGREVANPLLHVTPAIIVMLAHLGVVCCQNTLFIVNSLLHLICFHYSTLCSEKTPTYVFDYNSNISWSIFILFIPMKTGMNTLQYTFIIMA